MGKVGFGLLRGPGSKLFTPQQQLCFISCLYAADIPQPSRAAHILRAKPPTATARCPCCPSSKELSLKKEKERKKKEKKERAHKCLVAAPRGSSQTLPVGATFHSWRSTRMRREQTEPRRRPQGNMCETAICLHAAAADSGAEDF